MDVAIPGRFAPFESISRGEFFMLRNDAGKPQIGMKTHYDGDNGTQSRALRFLASEEQKPKLVLSESGSFTRDHTLFALDNIEIAPTVEFDFVGPLELEDSPVKPGWLGLPIGSTGGDALLTFSIQRPGGGVRAVELPSGNLLDEIPIAGWFRSWRIAQRLCDRYQTLIEMRTDAS